MWPLCFLLLSTFSFTYAQETEIHIEVAVGFSSTIPTAPIGRCTPIRVILGNEGEPFQGELLVHQKGSPQSYSVPVEVPTESRLAYHLSFSPKADPDYSEGEDLLEVRVLDDGGQEVRTEVAPLRFPDERDRVLAVFGTPRMPYGGLGFRPREEDSDTPARLVVPGDVDLLPEDVLEYEGIWAVVWDGQDWSSLSQRQCDALLQFVDMGGTLVIGSGPFWQGIMRTPIASHLPLAYEGTSPIGSTSGWEELGVSAPAIPEDFLGAFGPLRKEAEVLVTEWEKLGVSASAIPEDFLGAFGPLTKEAEVLVTAEGGPLIVRSQHGGGSIIQFGIPFASVWWAEWDDWSRFSDMIFRKGGLPDRRYASDPVLAELLRQQAMFRIRLPSRWQVAGVLVVHLLLAVVGGYFVFRRRDLLLAWGLFAVLAVLFGGSIYAIGSHLFSKQASVRTVTWLHARAGSRYALADTMMTLYSPRTSMYSLRFPQTGSFPIGLTGVRSVAYPRPQTWSPRVSPRRSRLRWSSFYRRPTGAEYRLGPPPVSPFDSSLAGEGIRVRFDGGPRIQDFLVRQWSTRGIRIAHVVDLQGRIHGELLAVNDEYRLRLQNESAWDLGKTYVMSAWGHREVADITTGRLVSSSNQAMRPAHVFHNLRWQLDARYVDPFLQSGAPQWSEWPWGRNPGRALLVSRLEMPVAPCEISPGVNNRESACLAAVELPVFLTGEAIDLPPSSWKWSVEEGDAYSAREEVAEELNWWDLPELVTLDTVRLAGAEATFRVGPGIDLGGWEIEQLRISFPAIEVVGPAGVAGVMRPPPPFLFDPVKKLGLHVYDFQGNVWTPIQFSEAATRGLSGQFLHPLHREVLLKIKARNEEAHDKAFSLNLEARIRRREAT
jgi:hypothetical protein